MQLSKMKFGHRTTAPKPKRNGLYSKYNYVLPPKGSFICYKKLSNHRIAVLYVPSRAKRVTPLEYRGRQAGSSGFFEHRKCRVSEVKVLAIVSASYARDDEYNIHHVFKEGDSLHRLCFPYRVGQYVKPDSFDDNIRAICTRGIHVFATLKEAVSY